MNGQGTAERSQRLDLYLAWESDADKYGITNSAEKMASLEQSLGRKDSHRRNTSTRSLPNTMHNDGIQMD